MKSDKLFRLTLTALLAAVLCILSPISVPIGPVPLSLGTFAVYLAASTVDRRTGTLAVLLYILLGMVGLPVFTGWTGGLGKLAGPTGGYIVGYVFTAYLAGLIIDRSKGRRIAVPLALIVGTVVLYAFGTAWYCIQAHTTPGAALPICVLPFLPGDALKIAAATAVALPVRKSVQNFLAKKLTA